MPESVVHFQIRMPPHQHERLASWAKEEKISLNLLVVGILEKAIEKRHGESAAKGGSNQASK
jgi:predicted HicB family RNase H-like nuclease